MKIHEYTTNTFFNENPRKRKRIPNTHHRKNLHNDGKKNPSDFDKSVDRLVKMFNGEVVKTKPAHQIITPNY